MDDDDLIAGSPTRSSALNDLCGLALRTLPIDGIAVVMVSTDGHRSLLSSAGTRAVELEDVSAVCLEGPAADSLRLGESVVAADLTDEAVAARWPIFTSQALALGVVGVMTVPLRIGAISLGVVVAHRTTSRGWSVDAIDALFRLAETVSYLIVDQGTQHRSHPYLDGELSDNLAWFVGAELHQASGMVMVQLGISIEAALARLRGYAFAHGIPLADVARAVIDRKLEIKP